MVIINQEINRFIEFLNSNWKLLNENFSAIKNRDEFQLSDLKNDWLQVNWEIIFESAICEPGEYVTAYGQGADCYPNSYRVRFLDKNPTFEVKGIPKIGSKVIDLVSNKMISLSDKDFFKFVKFDSEIYEENAPFSHALFQDEKGDYYVVEIKKIDFFKKKLEVNDQL